MCRASYTVQGASFKVLVPLPCSTDADTLYASGLDVGKSQGWKLCAIEPCMTMYDTAIRALPTAPRGPAAA